MKHWFCISGTSVAHIGQFESEEAATEAATMFTGYAREIVDEEEFGKFYQSATQAVLDAVYGKQVEQIP